VNVTDFPDDTLTFAVPIWTYKDGEVTSPYGLAPDADVTTCELQVTGISYANGSAMGPLLVTGFDHMPDPPCTAENLQLLFNLTNSLNDLFVMGCVAPNVTFCLGLHAFAEYYIIILIP
jgi:hypothetical protein